MDNIVEVVDLRKNYGTKIAVNGISFDVRRNEILGFLGPNGAGKTTIINILSTLLAPDSGQIKIMGHDLVGGQKEIKRGIGIVPQDIAIYEEISAEKNVHFFASLYSPGKSILKEQVHEALELVGLLDKKDHKPKTFSGGMKRRLNIACGIAHRPQLIVMDEPTVGIDPQSRNHILESIQTLQHRGATVIYSTHYMEEVEAIADRIIILNEGVVIAEGTKDDLKARINDEVKYTISTSGGEGLLENVFQGIEGVSKVKLTQNGVEVCLRKSEDKLNEIISAILSKGCKIQSMNREEASLETTFLELTGRSLRD